MSPFAVGWAFSLAIFFLGMSAAFAGRFVEKDIHKSSLISCVCFTTGMIGTGICIQFFTGWIAMIGIYLFYGVIMGIGLGVGYLTPVKTLMLWFSENKGLATGISIMGFGLAKAIATPIMELLQNNFGISAMFVILGVFYFGLMFLGHLLLKKPEGWVEPQTNDGFNVLSMFKDKTFICIWIMFFLNIHCGLMIISYEKQILTTAFSATDVLPLLVSIIPSITAGFNALGRIGYSTLSDKLKERNFVYGIIFISCIIIAGLVVFTGAIQGASILLISAILIIAFLLIINAGYGGGFSTLPALLSERFGMKKISQIHGLALSAWAIAGITGNNTSELLLNLGGNYSTIIFCGMILYVIAFCVCLMVGTKKQNYAE